MNKTKGAKQENARPPTDGTTEGFCEHFRLFDFRRVHLGPDHGTKRHFHAELVRDRERERGLAGAGCTNEEQRASREFARLYEFDDHTARLEASEREASAMVVVVVFIYLEGGALACESVDAYLAGVVLSYETGTVCGC